MTSRSRGFAYFLIVSMFAASGALPRVLSRAMADDCDNLAQISGQAIPSRFLDAGAPFVLQDNPTGFGDVAPATQEPSEGNELDQLYVTNDGSDLYIGITGNTDRTDNLENTVLLFIDTDGGTSPMTLDTAGCCADNTDLMGAACGNMMCEDCVAMLSISCDVNQPFYEWSDHCQEIAMNECAGVCSCDVGDPATNSNALREVDGLTLDFDPDYAVAIWNTDGTQHGVLFDLSLPANSAGTALTEGSGMDFVVNNGNLKGVNAEASNDPLLQQANAATAKNGYEIKLSLSSLGLANGSQVNLQAIIASGAGSISNQSLPPLNRTNTFVTPATGGGVVNPGDPSPDNPVDFNDESPTGYPGLQHVTYTVDTVMGTAPAGITDGTDIPDDYPDGSLLATQNNFTGFGDAEAFAPFTTDGSELDQMFVWSDNSKLYIGLTGNIPANEGFNNHILIFLDTVPFDQNFIPNNLSTSNPNFDDDPALQGMDQFVFDDDFTPDRVIQYDRQGNTDHADIVEMEFGLNTPLTYSIDISAHTGTDLSVYSADLSNVLGVNGIKGDDPLRQEDMAITANSGVQFSILLSDLGVTPGPNTQIKVAAMVAGGTGFVSNQWLPPLNETIGSPILANESASPMVALSDALAGDEPNTAVSTITPSDAVTQGMTRVTGMEVHIDLTHPDVSELAIDLYHPASGRTVRLWDRNQSGANMDTTFVVGGDDLSTWVAPGSSTDYESAQSLLTFNDVDPTDGDWVLFITDFVTGNTGTLNSWSISLREDLGGAIDCPGFVADHEGGIDLGEAPYNGNQFATVSIPFSPSETQPSSFSAQNIPGAFSALTGSSRAIQNNYTCFDDTVETTPEHPPGSEADAMFVTNTDNRLRVGVTGNLENNRNAAVLLIDTDDMTGTETPSGITGPPDPIGGNGTDQSGINQLTFDPGFTPDYALTVQARSSGANLFDAYLKDLNSNVSRYLGVVTRNSGDGTLTSPPDSLTAGSELDQMYLQNDANKLYIGLTGNLEGTPNHNVIIVLLDTDLTTMGTAPPLATLNMAYPAGLQGVDGDVMDDNFIPEFAVVLDTQEDSATLVDLVNGVVTPLTKSATATPPSGSDIFAYDNTNALGVSGTPDDDTGSPPTQQTLNAKTARKGFQLAIDRASLAGEFGFPVAPADGADIRVAAMVVSNSGYWSNQILPGLGGAVDNLGDNANLATATGTQYQTYGMSTSMSYTTPAGFDGTDIPADMGEGLDVEGAAATQDNYTQFGNQESPAPPDNPRCLQIAFDDSNVLGVTGDNADSPTSAETGIEFDIPFGDIGIPNGTTGSDIRLLTYVCGDFGYLSNQFLPPLGRGDAGNLNGELGISGPVDLSNDAVGNGDQFFTYTIAASSVCGSDPADINGDGMVNITSGDPAVNDITVFVDVLLGTNTDMCPLQKANVDGVGGIDGNDVQAFVDALVP